MSTPGIPGRDQPEQGVDAGAIPNQMGFHCLGKHLSRKNLSPDEDTNEQNIVAFNAAEPNANNTITSWYEKLYELYHFLPDTYKQMGKAPIQDRWRAQLPHHVLTEL